MAEKLSEFLDEGNPVWDMVFGAEQWEKVDPFEIIITRVQDQRD